MKRGGGGLAAALLGLACSGEAPVRTVDPGEGPQSGYFPVELVEPGIEAAEILDVFVGDIRAYAPTPIDEHRFSVMVQGHPQAGPADVRLHTPAGEVRLEGAFVYRPPSHPRFERLVAIGASLTQGVQNGVPNHHGNLVSPAAQLARQLGGYFPLPLLIPDFLPPMSAADIGPPPACQPPDVVAFVTQSAIEVLPKIQTGYHAARIDPWLEVHNLAVGGSKIHDVLYGPEEDNFGGNFVSHLVFDPFGTGPVQVSQLELALALEPTLVVSTDLFGNDVAAAILEGSDIDPARMTPLADIEADLEVLFEQLSAVGAAVFVANMPRPSLLPLTREKRATMIEASVAAGDEPEAAAAAADAAIADTDAFADAVNARLEATAQRYPDVHVVDVAGSIAEIAQTGVQAGGQSLTSQKLGGLLSFDGVHFTDTGYAVLANVFIDAINAVYGTEVPAIDLDEVVARDAGSPAAIAAAGLDVSLCER